MNNADETNDQVSPLSELGPKDLLRAISLIKKGQLFDLERVRYPGMPAQGPAHIPLQVLAHRTPSGIRAQNDQPWMGDNTVQFNWNSEALITTAHCGAHIDALAHATVGADDHWFGGGKAATDLGDFGPMKHDGASFPTIVTRGVMLDIPASLDIKVLPANFAITAAHIETALKLQQVEIAPGDSVLIRTGQLDGWPDADWINAHELSGIDLSAAKFLADKGVVAIANDGPCVENLPSSVPGNPHPVHIELLIKRGVFILEMVDCTELAREKAYEFCFIALPLKIQGTTASMIRPIAMR